MTIVAAHPKTYLYLIEQVLGNSEEPDEMHVQELLVLAWKIDEDGAEITPIFMGGLAVNSLWDEDNTFKWYYAIDIENDQYIAWNDDCDNRVSLEQAFRQVERKIKSNKVAR